MQSTLHELAEIIAQRQATPVADSYTNRLLADPNKAAQKVGEEAVEVVVAALGQTKDDLIAESADLLYHLLVLLTSQGVTLAEVEAKLKERMKPQ